MSPFVSQPLPPRASEPERPGRHWNTLGRHSGLSTPQSSQLSNEETRLVSKLPTFHLQLAIWVISISCKIFIGNENGKKFKSLQRNDYVLNACHVRGSRQSSFHIGLHLTFTATLWGWPCARWGNRGGQLQSLPDGIAQRGGTRFETRLVGF